MTDTNFWKLFKPKGCNLRLASTTKDATLREIVTTLIEGDVLEAAHEAEAVRALLEREKLGSTGVGMNVAIPHVKLKGLDRVACGISVSEAGVPWQAVDAAPVHIFFTVLRPEKGGEHHDPERHLEMMKWIARLSRDADFRRFAVRVKTKTELVDLLREKSNV
jgi:nitrogen PTS system EIIA component